MAYLSDVHNQEYWDGDWQIASEEGKPVRSWRDNCYGSDDCSATISAWIDIIGFRNESVINGTRYVNGSSKDFAIVKRDARYSVPSSMRFISFKSTSKVIDCTWDDGRISTEAIQSSKLVYEEWICYFIPDIGNFCYWQEYTDNLYVSCTTAAPHPYTTRIQDIPVRVVVCNRSFQPVTHIIIPDEDTPIMAGVREVQVTYNDSTVSRHDEIGFVVDNNRGTEYVEFVPFGEATWIEDDNQTEISHFLGAVTVSDPEFNMSKLQIQMRTPYETRNVTNYTVVVIDDTPISLNVPLLRASALICGAIVTLFALIGVIPRIL